MKPEGVTTYTTDANVLIAWVFPGRMASVVREFMAELTGLDELVAPAPECTSTIRREVHDRRLSSEDAREALEKLFSLPLQTFHSRDQFQRALDLAERFGHRRAYDMQYLAVAELTESELVTLDRGLQHAARETGVAVRLLR